MHRADKAVLRVTVGMGLAASMAYGFSFPMPFAVCAVAFLLLAKPGPPAPPGKGIITGLIVAALLLAGVLVVPILWHYPVTALAITAALLFAVFFADARKASPLTIFIVAALTFMPVAGVATQALVTVLAQALGIGLIIGALVNGVTHALFPDRPSAKQAAPAAGVGVETARWKALQATVVIMPVFVVALTNPTFYLPAIMKTVMVGQQANATDARSAGRELLGSTLMGAVMAAAVWAGLTLLPTLWMLTLWIMAASHWTAARMFGVRPTSFPPSFWLNALITMLILLGPGIEDAAVGKDVYAASATRLAIFVFVALYGWATVWALERWRSARQARGFVTPSQPMRR